MKYWCVSVQPVRIWEMRIAQPTRSSIKSCSGEGLSLSSPRAHSHHAAGQRRCTHFRSAGYKCLPLIAALLQFLKQLQDLFDARKSSGSVFLTEKRCRLPSSSLSTSHRLLTYPARSSALRQSPTSQQRRQQQEQEETSRWATRAAVVAEGRRAREQ